ncbi:monovalent cation/H+ antiporter subunit D family protein [Modestobacter sp. VKM Ac-2977]|uniref:monovalent cation/H+ antiporter subunit D family protein n=1 Tax=Modestobacter sp. VKM Ac-2977 TaxID=3004131 RepID=UPI0022AB3168|nr:monovalent cation/H+ antiporter subunit D family protein [Modestobacter sp. VKM Ac-2977]MCZ2822252.1 monovalent cation/H+ antiporter subunit D family protein [Modestobacter sp. VKM Ac-2977]
MTGGLLVLPVAGPLLVAGLLALVHHRWPHTTRLDRVVGPAAAGGVLVFAGFLLAATSGGAVPVLQLGGWQPGIAIVFAADTFSAVMLAVTSLLVLVSLPFAAALGEDEDPAFVPLVLVLLAGVSGAVLTADLFNLFVFIEVMLVPSYLLFAAGGGAERLAAARLYVSISLMASTVLLAGVGLVYGVAGTVNLGELAGAAESSPAVGFAAAVVLLALGVKSAVVPLHGWLPQTYSRTGPAVAALFSGLLTKVGVYAVIRLYSVVYGGAPRYLWVIMAVALLTMVVGVLGAVGEHAMRPVLIFHMVSQIGYVFVGLALSTATGLSATVFFLVQYVLVKTALLMCAGVVEHRYGTGDLDRLGGLARREPLLAGVFAVAALTLAGIPPLSGFVAKLGLASAAAAAGHHLAVALIVGVSLLTLLSMVKLWNGVFWEPPDEQPGADGDAEPGEASAAADGGASPVASALGSRVRPLVLAPPLFLAASAVVLGLWAEPLLSLSTVAGADLADPAAYVAAVTGR